MKSPFPDDSLVVLTVPGTQSPAVETALKRVVIDNESSRPIRSETNPTRTLPIALQALLKDVKYEPSESL
jgi:hypothetical protein